MSITAVAETASAGAGTNGARGPWTASYLAFVLPLSPEDVLGGSGGVTAASREDWRWVDAAQRLCWLYGPDEALFHLNGSPASPEPEARAA